MRSECNHMLSIFQDIVSTFVFYVRHQLQSSEREKSSESLAFHCESDFVTSSFLFFRIGHARANGKKKLNETRVKRVLEKKNLLKKSFFFLKEDSFARSCELSSYLIKQQICEDLKVNCKLIHFKRFRISESQ